MKRFFAAAISLLVLTALGIYLLSGQTATTKANASLTVAELMSGTDRTGFARAIAPREFIFPEDHGAHPRYQTEWWYYTGNLHTQKGRRFGYQFTLFRNALTPDSTAINSNWATTQVYMGHFTLSDVDGRQFHFFERYSRGANGLAGAIAKPFRVWLENWVVSDPTQKSEDPIPPMHISARQDDISLSLTLKNIKPVVLQGNQGLSQKGPEKGNASYYYSLTRLESTGSIEIGEDVFQVEGLSWVDREWSTSALGEDQAGWDWFSLQLSDGREIMYYQIRKKDGSADAFSKGIIVNTDGSSTPISASRLRLKVLDHWVSPRGGRYPSAWEMQLSEHDIGLTITPLHPDQELDVSIRYWEGAVKIAGEAFGKPVTGYGYVELTGYADH